MYLGLSAVEAPFASQVSGFIPAADVRKAVDARNLALVTCCRAALLLNLTMEASIGMVKRVRISESPPFNSESGDDQVSDTESVIVSRVSKLRRSS